MSSHIDRPPSIKEQALRLRSFSKENAAASNHESVDLALDFFTSTDPSESKLLNVLEDNDATTLSFASSRARPRGGGHRRKPSKLQQMVKQLSTRGNLHWDNDTDQQFKDRDNSHRGQPKSESQAQSQSNLYHSISNSEHTMIGSGSGIGGGGHTTTSNLQHQVERRTRTNSIASQGGGGSQPSGTGNSAARRASLPPNRDMRAPTSEFLSSLSKKLDDSEGGNVGFDSITPEEPTKESTTTPRKNRHRRLRTTTDALYDPHAQHLETLFQMGPKDNYEDIAYLNPHHQNPEQQGPGLLSDLSEDDEGNNNNNDDQDVEGGTDVSSPLIRRPTQQQTTGPKWKAVVESIYDWLLSFLALLGPEDIWNGIIQFLRYRFMLLMVPLLSISALLFYYFDNPNFHFLPGDATMSWWLIFAVRLLMTLSLAEASQYILEIIAARTGLIVRMAGPLLALVAMQSMGWPFLLFSWATLCSFLMRGDHPFCRFWLYFLHIDMFSEQYNSDHGVLTSEVYGRILLAAIFVGLATAAKRTAVVLYLGRRMLQHYRKQLRELLADAKVVMDVAQLAAVTDTKEFSNLIQEHTAYQNSVRSGDQSQSRGSLATDVAMTTLKATASKIVNEKIPTFPTPSKITPAASAEDEDDEDDTMMLSDDEDDEDMKTSTPGSGKSAFCKYSLPQRQQSNPRSVCRYEAVQKGPVKWNELKAQENPRRARGHNRVNSPIEMGTTAGEPHRSHRSRASNSTNRGLEKLVPRLERWEEPETKSKKVLPSLFDILQFRNAMQFLENPYPFSSAFGMARTRKECIRSSARVYRRLLRFTPGDSILHFEVLGSLAFNDEGELDEKRAQSLLKVFLPDKDDLLPQLSFLQAVDHVYKQLRFLRASILNSSKIDSVLNDGFDVIFNGILAIVVMTLLGLNVWPILVSFSTLMVSFAFSFGPSCAKYIEGTLMIAVRRPYDIGDRITIITGDSLANPSSSADTFFVEDITLSTTTLRFAATNEVSTVNNAAIANSRIVNGARSMNAIVTIVININVLATQEQIEVFRIRVENFLIDRPDVWAGLVHFRNDAVDHNDGYVRYLLRVQHKKSWQEMPPIMVHKGELERYCVSVAVDLGIVWQSSHHRIRVVEVPPIRNAGGSKGDDKKEAASEEEPFMKFMKAETGYFPGNINRLASAIDSTCPHEGGAG